jgi:hypothetical protein
MDENQKTTLLKWRARYKRAQLAHNYTAISYGRYHIAIGITLIVLTTAASVLTFAKPSDCWAWIPIVVSVSATILAAFQTFMKFSEQTEIHRVAARRYGELKKEVEYILNFTPDISNFPEITNEIRKKENEIAQESPNAISNNWKKAKKETQEENDKYSIRNRT